MTQRRLQQWMGALLLVWLMPLQAGAEAGQGADAPAADPGATPVATGPDTVTTDPSVTEYRLDNGLKILVKVDDRAPVVVSQIWYKVGASYEHGGITGVSHLLEHMMFKGTEANPDGRFSEIIAANGGRENAFTSRDYTAYFQRLEKSRLEISFRLEADRMRNLILKPADFDKERQVVIEERRMRTGDRPTSNTYERFIATAWQNSPYRNPVIGWQTDLDHATVDDLATWYRHWYAPNNATLVVVGDVVPEQVLALATQYFGPVAASAGLGSLKPRQEVEQKGKKELVVKLPAKLPYLLMGFKVPSLKTAEQEWEAYALEVLAGILDGGDSARLTRELIRGREIAVSAGAGYDLYARLGGLFVLDGIPGNGHTVAELRSALQQQIERLRNEPVDAKELLRVKTGTVTAKIYERDSVFYQAMQLGTLETVGLGWQRMDEYVDKVQAVTAGQIQQVARKYLLDDHLTVAELIPQSDTDSAAPSAGHNPEAGHVE